MANLTPTAVSKSSNFVTGPSGDKTNDVLSDLLANRTEIYSNLTSIADEFYGATPPANPNVGRKWRCSTTAGLYVANTTYRWNGSAWAIDIAETVSVPQRNCVLEGPVNSAGATILFSVGTGLTVDLKATVRLSFANGFTDDGGASDYFESITSDDAAFWSSLPINSTVQLYIDRDSGGTVTGGYSTIAPVYQNYAPTHSAGLNWFDTNTQKMFVSNGSAWTQMWRVFVGTATTDGTETTSVSINVNNSGEIVKAIDVISKGPLVDVRSFGAKGDGTTDDTTAIQAAVNSVASGGTVVFPAGTYKTTSEITCGLTAKNITFYSPAKATIKCDHTGNGINFETSNSSYGFHSVKNIIIDGPNTHYPDAGYTPTSLGAGLYAKSTYDLSVEDCIIMGFKYGAFLETGIGNKFYGDTYIRFNQYGVYFNSEATNCNVFSGIKIRENRIAGIYFNGGGSYNPTANWFSMCLIESNIPYPTVSGGDSPNDSVGVFMENTYNNIFNSCYFENHDSAIWLDAAAQHNSFIGCRFSPSADKSRLDKIVLNGNTAKANLFENCNAISFNRTTANVVGVGTAQYYNRFINCTGLNFISASLETFPTVSNNGSFLSLYGTVIGQTTAPYSAYGSNVTEDTVVGVGLAAISGIGTATAKLYAFGLNQIQVGNGLTADTTIDDIPDMIAGQTLIITNYQVSKKLTIKSTTNGTSGIMLWKRRNVTLSQYSDSIVLYKTHAGKIIEVGRNIETNITSSQTIDLPSIASMGNVILGPYTITGAEQGDKVLIAPNTTTSGLIFFGYVTAANTVYVSVFNPTANPIDVGNIAYYFEIVKY